MADSVRFRTLFYKLAPRWLTSGDGEKVLYSLGLVMDMFADRLKIGTLARMPEHAPEDALPVIGRDRKIVRGRGESSASYAARLLRHLDDHRVIGNPYALMDQLAAYLQTDVNIRTVDSRGNWFMRNADGTRDVVLDQGNWDWDGAPATAWSRFWVIIYSIAGDENAPWARIYWGDPGLVWGAEGVTWGSTATVEEVTAVRGIVRYWKPAHAHCKNIIVVLEEGAFNPTDPPGAPLPDGTWGRYGLDNVTASRDPRAMYWRGT